MAQLLIPDRPVAFGYKQIWLAVKHAEPQVVADALGLSDALASTWKEGIRWAYEQGYDRERRQYREWQKIFVSPPVFGWTLAVWGIGALPDPGMPEWIPWLCHLSLILGHVQSFGTHRVSSVVAWARVERGQIMRAYCHADGDTLVNEGAPTPQEVALGFDFVDERLATQAEIEAHEARVEAEMARRVALNTEVESLRAEAKAKGEEFDQTILDDERFDSSYDLLVPGEDSVMLLAGRWSLDPMRLEEIENEPGLGLVGKIGRRKYS